MHVFHGVHKLMFGIIKPNKFQLNSISFMCLSELQILFNWYVVYRNPMNKFMGNNLCRVIIKWGQVKNMTLGLFQQSGWYKHHDDVIKWKHFQRYWPFVLGIHRSLVNSQHKGQWHRALMFFFIWAWINGEANTREAGDLGCHLTHYDVTVMIWVGINFMDNSLSKNVIE